MGTAEIPKGQIDQKIMSRRKFLAFAAMTGAELLTNKMPMELAAPESQGKDQHDRATGLLVGVVSGGLLAAGLKLSYRATIGFIVGGGALGYCSGKNG